ncbi:mitogen-activated protein kinase kinase kinase 5-like isoform X2 [Cornus florida]|uniref:mitogen-activated protein kinase kinase kinase 5-like isoform X2 n=1 Tax=Cornus florida TaxID=4283 RepID=UPI002896E9F0|nr:mitogen-activated protein kinase kinase kinase 5-like isoform X2 [Cornus florida]
MTNLKRLFASRSSSSSPSDSPQKQDAKDNGFFNGKLMNRKLTRQRKLRHASDNELGLQQTTDRSRSLPVSPGSELLSPGNLGHWSRSAVPQPLPLPELHLIFKQNDRSNLSLPKEGPSTGEADGRDETGGVPIPSSTATGRKTTVPVAAESSRFPTYRRRGFRQDLNVDSVDQNFRLNFPARSAPTSGFTSPTLSPKRFSTVDVHSTFMVRQEFQVSSALEAPVVDSLAGYSQMMSARIMRSPDQSPLHSPTIQTHCHDTRSPTGLALHSYHKSLPESSSAWAESNIHANVHPLPLPPVVAKPSSSSNIRQTIEKPDVSSIKSQWQKGKLIGRGTFGTVYIATNRETGASCAMKEVDLIPDDPKPAECIKQLEQEIKVLRQLKHPNIVQYYGSEIVEDRFCILLEYVYPGSINKYICENRGAVTESVVRNFTRHILSGLAYLHSKKIVHRDIKGANLLVDTSGVVKLADFGLAKHLTGHFTDLSLKGSPHWMAPEVLQAVMRKDTNPELAYAVDIWSLGCTVIEMLDGKPPWSELNGVQAMFNVLNKTPPIPETLSSEGKEFLRWCFQRNPADRPSAVLLLEHPFLRNSHDQNVSVCVQEYSGMRLMETSHSPRERTKNVNDIMSNSPGTLKRHGKLPCNSESCKQSYPETTETKAASRHSPRSTLEVLPSISSPELNCCSHNISHSPNGSNSLLGAGSNYPYASIRTRGKEILHL